MKATIARFAVIVLLGFSGSWTWAAGNEGSLTFTRSPDKPISIRANTVKGRKIPGGWENVFKGKKGRQDLTLTSDTLTVRYEDKKGGNSRQNAEKNSVESLSRQRQIKSVMATGNVAIKQGGRRAKCGRAVYDNAARTIKLQESPRLWWGGNMVEAEVFVLYLDQK